MFINDGSLRVLTLLLIAIVTAAGLWSSLRLLAGCQAILIFGVQRAAHPGALALTAPALESLRPSLQHCKASDRNVQSCWPKLPRPEGS